MIIAPSSSSIERLYNGKKQHNIRAGYNPNFGTHFCKTCRAFQRLCFHFRGLYCALYHDSNVRKSLLLLFLLPRCDIMVRSNTVFDLEIISGINVFSPRAKYFLPKPSTSLYSSFIWRQMTRLQNAGAKSLYFFYSDMI